jgi:hypothetical protein
MVEILEQRGYTIPFDGNKRLFPYADLLVSDGICKKMVRTQEDGSRQYFTFNRKRYYVRREGDLYSARFVLDEKE